MFGFAEEGVLGSRVSRLTTVVRFGGRGRLTIYAAERGKEVDANGGIRMIERMSEIQSKINQHDWTGTLELF